MHKTGPNRRQNPGPARAAAGININKYKYKSAYFLRCVVGVGSVVTGSGAHVTTVAMVDNASRIRKAFMKKIINGIIVVQTNPTLHTLEPCSSHVETLRSV